MRADSGGELFESFFFLLGEENGMPLSVRRTDHQETEKGELAAIAPQYVLPHRGQPGVPAEKEVPAEEFLMVVGKVDSDHSLEFEDLINLSKDFDLEFVNELIQLSKPQINSYFES